MELEHRADGICHPIKRSLSDPLTAQPVVLNETKDRGLIGGRMIDEVVPRPRRDDEKRLPWTVSAPALSVHRSGIETGQRRGPTSASSRTGQRIGSSPR